MFGSAVTEGFENSIPGVAVEFSLLYFTCSDLEIKEKHETNHSAAKLGRTMLVWSAGYRNGPCGP